MNKFFVCTIKRPISSDDSKLKSFNYLFEAETYTEAESACIKIMQGFEGRYSIENIKHVDYCDIYLTEPDSLTFFSVQVGMLGDENEDGKDKIVDKYSYIVKCDKVDTAISVARGLFGSTDSISILQTKQTNIFEYYSRDDVDNFTVPVNNEDVDV